MPLGVRAGSRRFVPRIYLRPLRILRDGCSGQNLERLDLPHPLSQNSRRPRRTSSATRRDTIVCPSEGSDEFHRSGEPRDEEERKKHQSEDKQQMFSVPQRASKHIKMISAGNCTWYRTFPFGESKTPSVLPRFCKKRPHDIHSMSFECRSILERQRKGCTNGGRCRWVHATSRS